MQLSQNGGKDKVPHRRLLMKLKAHGIDGVVLEWIRR